MTVRRAPAALDPITGECAAPHHSGGRYSDWYAYMRFGCRCPAARQHMRSLWRRRPKGGRRVSDRYPSRVRAADVDEIAVERACMGQPPASINVPERVAAAARLTALGLSQREIAARLNVTTRTVVRYRNKVRAA